MLVHNRCPQIDRTLYAVRAAKLYAIDDSDFEEKIMRIGGAVTKSGGTDLFISLPSVSGKSHVTLVMRQVRKEVE